MSKILSESPFEESTTIHASGIPCTSCARWTCQNDVEPGVYYHYTPLETLWAILRTETLRATQARFSNDSEELQQGIRALGEFVPNFSAAWSKVITPDYIQRLLRGEGAEIDCYITCFCKQDDVLSQWRGYCRNGGVSIGFAFDETCPQFYLGEDSGCETGKHPFRLDQVWYMANNEDEATTLPKGVYSQEALKTILKEKFESVGDISDRGTKRAFFESVVPLIKHAGFREEDELRLLIFNTQAMQIGQISTPLDPYVEYVQADCSQRPYLALSFHRPRPSNQQESTFEITLDFYDLDKTVQAKLQPIFSHQFSSGQKCSIRKRTHATLKNKPQIVISEAEDSLQREVFYAIDRIVESNDRDPLFSNLKVWCSGHLPIRSIRVSPCRDQQEIIESIRHYCAHHSYWLKYVEVTGSKTPYRNPR